MGYASPYKMLSEMRPSEWGLWRAYWRLDPWGDERADLRTGNLMALMANINRDPKKRSQGFTALDFMLFSDPPVPKKENTLARMRQWFGHLVKPKGK